MRYTPYTVSIATSKLIPGPPSTHPGEAEAQRVTAAAACMMVCVPGPVPPASHRTIKHRGVKYPHCGAGHRQTAHMREGVHGEQIIRAWWASSAARAWLCMRQPPEPRITGVEYCRQS